MVAAKSFCTSKTTGKKTKTKMKQDGADVTATRPYDRSE